LNRINDKEELPENSLQLIENYGRDNKIITSYSIIVLKPDYPKGINPNGIAKNPLINIKVSKTKYDTVGVLVVSIPDNLVSKVCSNFPCIPLVKRKSDAITRANVPADSEALYPFFEYLLQEAISSYFKDGKDSFGCCHLYEKCSDVRKCLHENRLYARGCIYSRNLVEGRIFYGKNRNV
jgi:hypothetical protein